MRIDSITVVGLIWIGYLIASLRLRLAVHTQESTSLFLQTSRSNPNCECFDVLWRRSLLLYCGQPTLGEQQITTILPKGYCDSLALAGWHDSVPAIARLWFYDDVQGDFKRIL